MEGPGSPFWGSRTERIWHICCRLLGKSFLPLPYLWGPLLASGLVMMYVMGIWYGCGSRWMGPGRALALDWQVDQVLGVLFFLVGLPDLAKTKQNQQKHPVSSKIWMLDKQQIIFSIKIFYAIFETYCIVYCMHYFCIKYLICIIFSMLL